MEPRIVFMGSPEFAVPVLTGLVHLHKVVGVITQPDRPAGRGQKMTEPPVKRIAIQQGIPVFQPEKIRLPDAWEKLIEWSPDLIVVAAYGQILKQNILDLPKYGCINVHASLLPRWRGASPIQAAILNGDKKTGITIMKINAGLDTGDILAQEEITILENDTAGSLGVKLADLGVNILLKTIPDYLNGKIKPVQQSDESATYVAMIKKEDALLDFSLPIDFLERKIRAFDPWPCAFFIFNDKQLKVKSGYVSEIITNDCGKRTIINGLPAISAAGGSLVITEIQPAGKRIMSGKEFLMGARDWISHD